LLFSPVHAQLCPPLSFPTRRSSDLVCRPSDRLDLDLSCSLDCPEWQSLHGRHFIGFPLCGSSLATICSRLLVVFSWCRPALTALARLSPSLYPPQQL